MPLELLEPGTIAPAFTAKDQNGNDVSLSDFRGKKVILYFYPKDDTPGCTKEACNFRDNFADLKEQGFEVLGVSPDSESSHQKFISKYDLNFTLLADENKEVIMAYKAWGEKNNYGKKYMGLHRVTYLIDEEGKIEHIIKRVKTAEATEQILKKYAN